ncbi:LLM class flavin-dependent oxidoreductase [Pseudonocardia xishanensis]
MGVGLFPTEPVPRMRELVLQAEQLGYANAWVGDSQNIWRDATVTLGAASVGTSRIILGTGVTNPVTRHPSVQASTWASLHEATAGRVAMGVGVGDSALFTMGLKPARLQELESTITDLRSLWAGREVTEGATGTGYRLAYLDEPSPVPVYIAATGPKILQLAGRVADGVILLAGTSSAFVEAGLRMIEKGAAEAGRTLDDLHIVLWTPTAIDPDPVAARDLVRAHVARVAMRPLPVAVGPAEAAAIERIRAAYDYYEHMEVGAAHSALVPDSLVDLFALAGTPDECAARLTELDHLGVDQVAIVPYVAPGADRADTLSAFAEIVSGERPRRRGNR